MNVALERLGGDEEFFAELVELFVAECPKLLSDIGEALRQEDSTGLEHAAHTLKGAVSNFEAERATELAANLESMGRTGDLLEAASTYVALEEEVELVNSAISARRSEHPASTSA